MRQPMCRTVAGGACDRPAEEETLEIGEALGERRLELLGGLDLLGEQLRPVRAPGLDDRSPRLGVRRQDIDLDVVGHIEERPRASRLPER